MKTSIKPATRKLLVRFDNELKKLLSNDLKLFTDKNPFLMSKKKLAEEPLLSAV